MVYYAGLGKMISGTQRVSLKEDKGWPLEVKIRNFKNKYSKNAYVWGIFDSCRISAGGGRSLEGIYAQRAMVKQDFLE